MWKLLEANGVHALFVDSRSVIRTDEHFWVAVVDWPTTQHLIEQLSLSWTNVSWYVQHACMVL